VTKANSDVTVVAYIGRREAWLDNQYGTGLTFVTKQARTLPNEIAQKLLRHQDLFAVAAKAAPSKKDDTDELLAAAENGKQEDLAEINRRFNLIADVMNMEKSALKDFASAHYRQDLNGKLNVETLRHQVVGLIDQYGVS
jgi:hypothetical protein